jgi:hypothetical protein
MLLLSSTFITSLAALAHGYAPPGRCLGPVISMIQVGREGIGRDVFQILNRKQNFSLVFSVH